ncbi:MAG: S53 family peptidase [Verrucomicrobiota bacterium]
MTSRFFLLLATLLVVQPSKLPAENCDGVGNGLKPSLQWKYGWKDGKKGNTIGKARDGDVIPAASGYLSTGYVPAHLSHAYGFDQIATSGDGRGQTIAVIVAYGSPTIQQDLNTFCAQYNLPPTTLSVAYPLGKPARPNSGWAGETTLDVEWSHAMAPGASIAVVVAPDPGLTSLLSAVNYAVSTLKASVVSMSWGTPEFQGASLYDSYFNKPGVSFVASSGDSGAGVSWPASSPYVVGVGGTTLLYDTAAGTVLSEVAWSGSGGGTSRTELLPTYQAGWNANAGRGVPDISYNADPYTGVSVYFTDPATNVGGWHVFGGTSAGTPQWAALLARRASLGNAGTDSFNAALYSAAKTGYSTVVRDIVSGSNGYPAVSGYDLVTGLGTPVARAISVLPKAVSAPTPVATPTPVPSPTATPTPKPTPTPTPAPKPTPTPTPKPTPTPTPTPKPPQRPWWPWWPWR